MAALAVVTMLVLPSVNYASVCVRSQVSRLSGVTVDEELRDSELGRLAGSAYEVLADDCGYRGREIIDSMYSEKERKILASCSEGTYSGSRTEYLSDRADIVDFDVSDYKTLTFVDGNDNAPGIRIIALTADGHEIYKADLTGSIKDLEGFGYKKSVSVKDTSFDLSGYEPIELDESYDLKITWFSAEYNPDKKTLEYLNLEGYLLARK